MPPPPSSLPPPTASSSRIPPLLQPYTHLPSRDSLTLVTDVLGASTNWLLLRFLCGALATTATATTASSSSFSTIASYPATPNHNSALPLNSVADIQNTGNRGTTGNGGDGNGDGNGNGNGNGNGSSLGLPDDADDGDVAVVLVSWMRDWDFWRAEGRRSVGLDIPRLVQQKRVAFVDGLTHLFSSAFESSPVPVSPSASASGGRPPVTPSAHVGAAPIPAQRSPIPVRSVRGITPRATGTPLIPGRGVPGNEASAPPAVSTPATVPQPAIASGATAARQSPPTSFVLKSPSLAHFEEVVQHAIDYVKDAGVEGARPKRVLLIFDHPDLLLATAPPPPSSLAGIHNAPQSRAHHPSLPGSTNAKPSPNSQLTITPTSLNASIFTLRLSVHSCLVSTSADSPLMSLEPTLTPLEGNHASFVIGLAHMADWVISARLLDTGFAKDVSGVLRITKGCPPGAIGGQDEQGPEEKKREEKEVLYLVRGDGAVKVFERGAAGGEA